MDSPQINTSYAVVPMCYGYSTPEIKRHDGWTKIGYTEKDVTERIKEQTHTADVVAVEEWRGQATFDDGSGESFKDKQFHSYLRKCNIEQEPDKDNEWFHVDGPTSHGMFKDFRSNRGILKTLDSAIEYQLRAEQEDAVSTTLDYIAKNPSGEYLWNAKPRFGKTLAVYDLIKRIPDLKTVLIVTNRPAVATSWFSDYQKFLGSESDFLFVSEVQILKETAGVLTPDEYGDAILGDPKKRLQFMSLQDLKGSLYFGGKHDKHKEESKYVWDLLVIDEAHEAVDTFKTDVAFDRIKRKFTLHLSGTPFKAIAKEKFPPEAIYNWTYADEQQCKAEWKSEVGQDNPYSDLPQINLYTYKMSEIVKDEIKQGVDIDGENVEYAFNLNDFFSTNKSGRFIYDSSVDKFLDALTLQKRFPFSTEDLRSELKHTFWLLNRVDSAKALARKLKNHPVFKDYYVVVAAGDGRIDEDEEIEQSFTKVKNAIAKYDKTITLSVGQLTTGVTVPEWSAVLMLSDIESPALYMQAAFRAQNPCLYQEGIKYGRKENCYIFDFNPARTLIKYEEFANDLYSDTAAGKGDSDTRKNRIKTLLNFFPVIGEDENGELIQLNENKVLTIPRKIKSVEVVKRGFMSNFLFQNIGRIFGAPKEVIDMINQFEPVKESKRQVSIDEDTKDELSLDSQGNVEISEESVEETANDLFGDNVYDVQEQIDYVVQSSDSEKSKKNEANNKLKEAISETAVKQMIEKVRNNTDYDVTNSDAKKIETVIKNKTHNVIEKQTANHDTDCRILENDRQKELENRHETGKTTAEIEKEFDQKKQELNNEFRTNLVEAVDDFLNTSEKEVVRTVETNSKEQAKKAKEDEVKDHLRGFARTIPSFLMAYGDDTVTLATFDKVVPDDVFKEATSISLDQFKFLRDGGDYVDKETGETKHFDGEIFDPVVFDDSVREFLALKDKLSNYFLEDQEEDIFDYIPPQKTNQIFTPKKVVKRMVDLLEEENPGCFDDSSKTFIDLYMKSGLYIAEIVKRLFNSSVLTSEFPDEDERLQHIFANQVYGLAPTEIIYRIAVNFILGFSKDSMKISHNFALVDTLPLAKEGTLEQRLEELYEI